MVLVMAMASFLPSSGALAKSSLAQYFLVAGRAAVYAGPGELKQKFRDGLKALEQVRDSSTSQSHAPDAMTFYKTLSAVTQRQMGCTGIDGCSLKHLIFIEPEEREALGERPA